jgi:hypothetical protein
VTVNDTFLTVDSANINPRSMWTDYERNLAIQDCAEVRVIGKRLWRNHARPVNGATHLGGAQENHAEAFEKWGALIGENSEHEKRQPIASLRGFLAHRPENQGFGLTPCAPFLFFCLRCSWPATLLKSLLSRRNEIPTLGVTADEIDEIAPLLSVRLPPRNGQLEWVESWNADVPPPIPNEARIAEMAKARGLDPATGRPATP